MHKINHFVFVAVKKSWRNVCSQIQASANNQKSNLNQKKEIKYILDENNQYFQIGDGLQSHVK